VVLLDSKHVAIIAPHPDDETLGAGGTLLRLAQAGASLTWLLVTTAENAGYPAKYVDAQRRQVEAVRGAYPFDQFHWFGLPARALDRADFAALVETLRVHFSRLRPDTIIVPHMYDAHSDHRVCHAAALAACKSFYMTEFGVRRILAMEILSETDAAPPVPGQSFLPTVTVDITKQLQRKVDILQLYQSELQSAPKPRRLDVVAAQANAHGAACGLMAAERFMLIREVVA
jgi:N-acetylglucosamine malate deacetylase 1